MGGKGTGYHSGSGEGNYWIFRGIKPGYQEEALPEQGIYGGVMKDTSPSENDASPSEGAVQNPLPVCFMGTYPEIRAILCTKGNIKVFQEARYSLRLGKYGQIEDISKALS